MYDIQTRYGAYKRGVIYFTIYSAILFFVTPADFLQLKTILYFLLGYAISGAVAVLFMSWQYKIEKGFNPNFWILNIVIDVVGYFVYSYALFYLTFSII
jgi:H+/Cl- antiporter ClcA